MNQLNISKCVEQSIKEIITLFQSKPTLFFTENDIVCTFHGILNKNLSANNISDKNNLHHNLIHTEYPTPFRCSMKNNQFHLKDDHDITKKGRNYQRGHYDMVVFNPEFIKNHTYEIIKAQNYEIFKNEVLSEKDKTYPVILYGLEFMFQRDPLKYSRGENKEKGIDLFVDKIVQDSDKLLALNDGFMKQIKMLTFIKDCNKDIRELLNKKISRRNEIILCFN